MMIAIHQPNFFPWLPFFEKMKSVDKFVILNHCQFEKNNYQNRFLYKDSWCTMSVQKGLDLIIEKKYINPFDDWSRIKRKISNKRQILEKFDSCISENLSLTNSNLILSLAQQLDIKTEIVFDEKTDLTSNERLIWICKKNGANKYLSGSGGKNYVDLKKFTDAGIEVIFQDIETKDKIHVLDVLKDK